MSTITAEQQQAIADYLVGMTLPSGLGTEESACSIAAINLALTGKLTDKIPYCMSEVIGRWIIAVQDAMPEKIRNSHRWKSLLPLAAGTGRDRERERLDIIMDWMWGKVLPALQPVADEEGFGAQWKQMTTERTVDVAARVAAAYAAARAARVEAAYAAAYAAAKVAADAAYAAARAAKKAAYAAADAAARVAGYAAQGSDTDAWITFDPRDLLERLIRVGEQQCV